MREEDNWIIVIVISLMMFFSNKVLPENHKNFEGSLISHVYFFND